MKLKTLLCVGAAVSAFAATAANAATIVLVDQGFAGTAQQQQQFRDGFAIAAAYWSNTLSNNVTIRLGIGSASLGTGIIGSTGSSGMDYSVANWEAGVNATKSNSALDAAIVLPTLTNGAVAFLTNGPGNTTTGFGINTNTLRYDNQTTGVNAINNNTLYLNTANVKAIGGVATYNLDPTSQGYNPGLLDGEIQFSTNFGFDFDPTDGVSANTFDFIGTAIHEIGHALGFVSGVDVLDYFGRPSGPGRATGNTFNFNQTSIFSALDMFRYGSDPTNLVPGTGAVLDLSAGKLGGNKYFSIDGGLTQFNGNSLFSTGSYNGDGNQASHWKDSPGCNPQLGIMDPTECYGTVDEVKALDLAAFDAIGWNLAADSRSTSYLKTTADIYRQYATAPVPEPATWAMMIAGFGLVGGAMRRRSTKIAFAA